MTGQPPMTPARLAELQARYDGLTPDAYAADHPATHVVELLAEVQLLTGHAATKDQAIESLRRTLNHNLDRADKLATENRELHEALDVATARLAQEGLL